MNDKPKIVCLCGSTRFFAEFQKANRDLTLEGKIVLTVGFFSHSQEAAGSIIDCTEEMKVKLDELHLRKIDLADEVFILNVGGYIGSSCRRELAYAIAYQKEVTFLEPEAGGTFMESNSRELGRLVVGFVSG